MLRVSVRDNSVAAPIPPLGLVGLRDRVEALGGTITVDGHQNHGGPATDVALPFDPNTLASQQPQRHQPTPTGATS